MTDLIQQLCAMAIAHAEKLPLNVEAQRMAEMARQILSPDEMLPIYDTNAAKPEGEL